jgi:tetratricopeptide (TPR) repeat protein
LRAASQSLNQALLVGKSLPDGSPSAIALKVVRGRIALSENRLQDARAALTDAIGVASAPGAAYMTRAEVELAQGALHEAATDAQQALALAQGMQRGTMHSNRTGLAWLILGRVKAAVGDRDGARAAFEAAVAHLDHTVDGTHPALRLARRLLAAERSS